VWQTALPMKGEGKIILPIYDIILHKYIFIHFDVITNGAMYLCAM